MSRMGQGASTRYGLVTAADCATCWRCWRVDGPFLSDGMTFPGRQSQEQNRNVPRIVVIDTVNTVNMVNIVNAPRSRVYLDVSAGADNAANVL